MKNYHIQIAETNIGMCNMMMRDMMMSDVSALRFCRM